MSQPNEYDLTRFREVLKGRKASPAQQREWVQENFGRSVDDVPAAEPPDCFSVALLAWANDNSEEFIAGVFKASLNAKQVDTVERAKDDGRTLEVLDQLEAELEPIGVFHESDGISGTSRQGQGDHLEGTARCESIAGP